MNAYRCNSSRFSALVNDKDDKHNPRRYPTKANTAHALANLNAEPLYMGKFDQILVHEDAPTSILPEKKTHKKTVIIHEGPSSRPGFLRPLTTNAEFAATDRKFIWVCRILGITPTTRQASKWRRQTGAAWNGQREAVLINRRRIAQAREEALSDK